MSYHSLFRAITTNPALSLVILSYHPSYNQDFSELWNHPTPSNLSFDNVIPYPVLSRQILPYHFLSLVITNLITKIFFRTLISPHPFENHLIHPNHLSLEDITHLSRFFRSERHSLSRAITPNPALSLLILSYYQSYNQDFSQNSKSPHPFEFILWWRHSLSRAITPNPPLSLVILSYHSSYNQDFSEL